METPLTPLEFARRARRLYPDREAVVDGNRRLTYRDFFERCGLRLRTHDSASWKGPLMESK